MQRHQSIEVFILYGPAPGAAEVVDFQLDLVDQLGAALMGHAPDTLGDPADVVTGVGGTRSRGQRRTRFQALRGELAHGLQHGEARRAAAAFSLSQQALVGQRHEPIDRVDVGEQVEDLRGDLLNGFDFRAGEAGEHLEEALLAR